MRIALIFNPFSYKVHEENLRIVQKYFGLFPPLSLAWVAAIAEEAGHEATIIDARTLGLSKEETLAEVRKFKPDILGFMMTTYMFQETLQWIKYLKKHTALPVVIGGYNLRVYPVDSVSHDEIDFGVKEQALYAIPELLNRMENNIDNFDDIPGLIHKKNGEIFVNEDRDVDFNDYPFPARHLLPNELYAEFPTEFRNFTVMVTSLGCPYQCSFCEAGNTPYKPRSADIVVDEMELCNKKFSIREIDIFDYNFTTDANRVKDICNKMIERKLKISWACRSRVDIEMDLLKKMREAGCSRIYFGLESGNQEILDEVQKGMTLDQIRTTVENSHSLGIRNLGFFLIGAPGDTHETVRQTVDFAKSLPLDYAQFSKCLSKPLTPLWKEVTEKTGKDFWKEWILGNETDREIPRPWTELTNSEIDSLAKKAYLEFYFRPKFIFSALLKLKSYKELIRKSSSALDMLFSQEKQSVSHDDFAAFNENKKGDIKKVKKNLLG